MDRLTATGESRIGFGTVRTTYLFLGATDSVATGTIADALGRDGGFLALGYCSGGVRRDAYRCFT